MSRDIPASNDHFCLQRRNFLGGTAPLSSWGFQNETDPLTDVLLGPQPTYGIYQPRRYRANTCATHPATFRLLRHNTLK